MRFLSRAENEAKAAEKAAALKRSPEEKVSRRNYLLNCSNLDWCAGILTAVVFVTSQTQVAERAAAAK